MLSRRTLIVGTAAITAGCGFLKSPLSAPGSLQPTALNWVSGPHLGLSDRLGTLRPREILQQSINALQDDEENPHGPKRGRYELTLRYVEYSAIPNDYPACSMRSKPTLSPSMPETRRRWRKAASGCPWTSS